MINDERILEAARRVLFADPAAPIAEVAKHAGVGISAFYSRYRSKDALLERLCFEGLQQYVAAVEAALADEGDAWMVYRAFMRRIVDADTHAHVLRLAGRFTPSPKLHREAQRTQRLNVRLFDRTKAAGVLRPEIEAQDIALLFELLAAIDLGDPARTAQARQRHLALILDGLRSRSGSTLPGRAPSWDEINRRWDPG